MSQQTRVYVLDRAQRASLHDALRERLPPEADWRRVPHAAFSVKALGVVATCYDSGKLVVQGPGVDAFEGRFLAGIGSRAAGDRGRDLELDTAMPATGSDEAGKGDYFGPLVVAAVRVEEPDAGWLARLGVADSKTLSDQRARRLAGAIEERLAHGIVSLPPEEYNRRYAAVGNLNRLLADLHADALAAVAGRGRSEVIVVDRFAAGDVLAGALRARGLPTGRLVEVPRAESHPAVAAASVLARAAFLEGLARSAADCATELPKGAGRAVDRAARRVHEIGGDDLLGKVAKLHFKNTLRARR